MERSHDQFREGDAESKVAEIRSEPKPEVTDTAEPNGPHTDRNEREGTEQEPSATEEALARTPQPEEPDIEHDQEANATAETLATSPQPEEPKSEDDPEPSANHKTLATAQQPEKSRSGGILEELQEPEVPQVQSPESVLAELEATVQSKLSAITICWIEIAHILASVHSNFPPEVFDEFVKKCRLKPNMATKLRAVGTDCWFNRPEVREQFKHAERTELYYAHLLDDGQKEKLLAKAETGKPISRKLIDAIRGETAKPKEIFRVAFIEVNLQSMCEWKAQDRTSFCQLITNLKLQCDTSSPFGVSFIEKLEDLLRKK